MTDADQASSITLDDEVPPSVVTEPGLILIASALVTIAGASFVKFVEEPNFRNLRSLIIISVITVSIVVCFFDQLKSAKSDSVQSVISLLTFLGLLTSRGNQSKRILSLGLSALALRNFLTVIFQLGLLSIFITIAFVRSHNNVGMLSVR